MLAVAKGRHTLGGLSWPAVGRWKTCIKVEYVFRCMWRKRRWLFLRMHALDPLFIGLSDSHMKIASTWGNIRLHAAITLNEGHHSMVLMMHPRTHGGF